jgi:hypothetical protein
MAQHIGYDEIELKRLLIGAGAADKLVAVLGPVPALKRQVNHVFDTEDRRLNRQRYSVRLRLEDGTPIVTAKGPSRGGGGRPLCEVGHFENQRRTVPVVRASGLALTVEIDRTRFPDGRVDDEIEIEIPSDDVVSEVEAWLDERAAAAGIAIGPSRSKDGRFFATLPGAAR